MNNGERGMSETRELKKHAGEIGRWRLMCRRGRYRWAMERRPAGTYVLATPAFIFTALRRNKDASRAR
jgi:hypothetical protein